eukprot:4120626-Amphidinium_carterae.1
MWDSHLHFRYSRIRHHCCMPPQMGSPHPSSCCVVESSHALHRCASLACSSAHFPGSPHGA